MEGVIAAGLAVMVVLVFGNVVLRYGFNSGITVSEEVSRWLFVWITLLGAIVAAREHGHLGVDMVVARLPAWGKKACLVVSHLLMLFLVGALFKGGWDQVAINWRVEAPTTGLSMAIVHIPALVFAVGVGALLLLDLFKILTGRVADADLVMVQESEEATQLRQVLAEADAGNARKAVP
ncbi:MAG: TRAP transporter small permease [Comamonadaceae bacterium]|nr:MAG: TRAP transporter small permease [Comamonadaceae bacterium]